MSGIPNVSFTIDWIAATFTKDGGEAFLQHMWLDKSTMPVPCAPTKGYKEGYEFESGLRYSTNREHPERGCHVVFSGSTLRWYWATGFEWRRLMELIAEHEGRTSRVDLAFDFKDSGIDAGSLVKPNLKPYKGRGRTPKFNTLTGEDGSWTKYIGSRSSEKFLRIYDKAKEQGDYVGDYIRVELECKGEVAHAVGWTFARQNAAECVGMARALVTGVANFNIPAWEDCFERDVVDFSIPQGKQRDTFHWLVKVCAPSLAREIAKRPKDDVLQSFWDALRLELGKRGIPTDN